MYHVSLTLESEGGGESEWLCEETRWGFEVELTGRPEFVVLVSREDDADDEENTVG